MSKRHFMSILGTGAYSECTYKFNDDIFRTRFIQEALLSFNDFTKEDRMTIFLTEKARELNFKTRECGENDCKCNKYKPGDILIGLGEILKNKYGDSIEIVDIADGKTEDEQWEIFSTIFENIKDDEEIVFDITHGFRTIPMLAFAVLNYARVLKNISLNSIYYGAFEAKYDDGTVPIWNCTSYIDIMDWTYATDSFVKYGNGEQIFDVFSKIKKRQFKENDKSFFEFTAVAERIKNFTTTINTGRGRYIEIDKKEKSIKIAYDNFIDNFEKSNIENVKDIKINIFKNIVKYVKNVIYKYFNNKETETEIGIATVEWCIQYNLIQQGYTALEETIKTYICEKYNLDTKTKCTRENIAGNALNALDKITQFKTEEEINNKKEIEIESVNPEYREIFAKILDEESKTGLFSISSSIKDFRNDINHFGFNITPRDASKFKTELREKFEKFKKIIEQN